MLALTVPGLLAADMRSVKTLAPLQTLARYADPPALHKNGIGEALLATLGLDAATPLAPLCAQGAGIDAHRYIVGATPVTLTADRDIVVLERRVDDLDAEDAATLIDLLNRHFADDALQFVAPRPSTWFIESTRTFSFSTFALDAAIGRSVYPYLPRGPDANAWRRWQVEIQMLLHEHPVNVKREARRLSAASSVWLWGNGRLDDVARPALQLAFAPPDESGDLVRGLAYRAGLSADTLPAASSAIIDRMSDAANVIIALPAVSDDAALERFAIDWLQPAVSKLAGGRLDALSIIADGHGAAASWIARRPSPLARVTSRLRRATFEIPALTDE